MKDNLGGLLASSTFAEEALVVDVQALLHQIMEKAGLSRADLARRMKVSRARVTQMFSDDCPNMTLRFVARAFHSLGETVEITCESQKEHEQRQDHQLVQETLKKCDNVVMGNWQWEWESNSRFLEASVKPISVDHKTLEKALIAARGQVEGSPSKKSSSERRSSSPRDWLSQAERSSALAVVNG